MTIANALPRCCMVCAFAACLFPVSAAAQIYRVYRPIPRIQEESTAVHHTWFSIHTGAALGIGPIKDPDNGILTHGMYGMRYGADIHIGSILRIGAEYETLKATDKQVDDLRHIRERTTALLLKWILTPDTEPKLYLITGVGKTHYETAFTIREDDLNGDGRTWIVGLGAEWKVWKGLQVNGEYRIRYEAPRWDNFILRSPRMWQELSVGIGYRF